MLSREAVAVAFALAVGLGGAVVAARALAMTRSRRDLVRRLQPRGSAEEAVPAPASGLGAALAVGLRPIARLAQPSGEAGSRLKQQILRAGLRREHAMQVFLVVKVVLAIALVGTFLWLQGARAEPLRMGGVLAVAAAATGFYGPNLWLASRVRRRQRAIERGLADALDLLVTCVEAGLGLDAALMRISDEIRLAHPVLSDETQLTFLEVKAGLPRVEAFRRLADRTGVDELRHLSATLTQTEMFGTSVGVALRVQAEGIRTRRMQRAEERAAKVAVKMTLPLVFCILPSLLAVIVGPAIVNIGETLFTALGKR
jgi:tight adherence protein C